MCSSARYASLRAAGPTWDEGKRIGRRRMQRHEIYSESTYYFAVTKSSLSGPRRPCRRPKLRSRENRAADPPLPTFEIARTEGCKSQRELDCVTIVVLAVDINLSLQGHCSDYKVGCEMRFGFVSVGLLIESLCAYCGHMMAVVDDLASC